jgi:hypothetical protein
MRTHPMSHIVVDCPALAGSALSRWNKLPGRVTLKMSVFFQIKDDPEDTSGRLSGHDVGMVCGTVGFIIITAIGMAFFKWHLRSVAWPAAVWFGICYWGYASERAENMERRLKRIERKLDKALEHFRDRT